MSFKSSAEIRQDFFDFFEEKQHLRVPSAPVVPQNDPTLLFTNAGMNPFKPIFMGEQLGYKKNKETYRRIVDTQRCIRVSGKHNDLEEVGHDTYHHTLFEMLGNWSFGDYFKQEAIRWAWELLVDKWELEPDRLYATVFGGDEEDGLPVDKESIGLWESETDIRPDHIMKFGKKDNFWEMGDTGPCGPCSEVHIDVRPEDERARQPGTELVNQDDPRVMEIWNLVFIQFNRQPDASLNKLPARHVDTGMGFERICAILQSKRSNYDSDVFTPLLDKIGELANTTYGEHTQKDIAMRVIADHIRAVAFSIADGVSPGNEGRNYVIRRILRRAVRYGWDALDLKKSFLYELVTVLAKQFKDVFPVLINQQNYVVNVIRAEEKSFLKTLGDGIKLFEDVAEKGSVISGAQAFKLHDTYGFPIDLTRLMAHERGIKVDVEGFNKHMEEQKERARAAGTFKVDQSAQDSWTMFDDTTPSRFVGYDQLNVQTNIKAWRKTKNDRAEILLTQTPFYAESGGQVADKGIISNGDEQLKVIDVQKSPDGHVQLVDHLPGDLSGKWEASVEESQRREIRKHHTATHLLHAALQKVLGDHVAQKGSLVDEHHLRFDFSHYEPVTEDEIHEVERIVNQRIQENIACQEEREVPIEQAQERGATMLFGEKYGDKVRIITFDPDYSMELCGGTHAEASGELGYFRITQETSAAAGVRRIEARVGKSADQLLQDERQLVDRIEAELGQTQDIADEISRLLQERNNLEKEVESLRHQQSATKLDEFLQHAQELKGIALVSGEIPHADMDLLKQLGYESLQKNPKCTVTILGAADNAQNKVYIMVAVTDDLIKKHGLKAGALAGALGQKLGGGGGGQPDLATAGGSRPEKLSGLLENIDSVIEEYLS